MGGYPTSGWGSTPSLAGYPLSGPGRSTSPPGPGQGTPHVDLAGVPPPPPCGPGWGTSPGCELTNKLKLLPSLNLRMRAVETIFLSVFFTCVCICSQGSIKVSYVIVVVAAVKQTVGEQVVSG